MEALQVTDTKVPHGHGSPGPTRGHLQVPDSLDEGATQLGCRELTTVLPQPAPLADGKSPRFSPWSSGPCDQLGFPFRLVFCLCPPATVSSIRAGWERS